MFNRRSQEELQNKLESVNAAIAAHPLASDRITRAHAIIESTDSNDKESVNKKLAENDLPDLATDLGQASFGVRRAGPQNARARRRSHLY